MNICMFVDIGLLVFFLLKEIYEILSFRLILIEVVDMLIIVIDKGNIF